MRTVNGNGVGAGENLVRAVAHRACGRARWRGLHGGRARPVAARIFLRSVIVHVRMVRSDLSGAVWSAEIASRLFARLCMLSIASIISVSVCLPVCLPSWASSVEIAQFPRGHCSSSTRKIGHKLWACPSDWSFGTEATGRRARSGRLSLHCWAVCESTLASLHCTHNYNRH